MNRSTSVAHLFLACLSAALVLGCKTENITNITTVVNATPFWTPVNAPVVNGSLAQVQRLVKNGNVVVAYGNQLSMGGIGTGLQQSTDNGTTWAPIPGNPYPGTRELIVTRNGTFVGWTAGGIIRSTNGGAKWDTTVLGLAMYVDTATGTQVLNVALSSLTVDSANNVFASAVVGISPARYTVYRSSDNGLHWEEAANGLNGDWPAALAVAPNGTIFASTYFGVFTSTDHGANWQFTGTGLPAYSGYTVTLTSWAFLHDGTIIAGSGTQGMYRSTDGGATWNYANVGLPLVYGYTCVAGVDASTVYACASTGVVYKSTNSGAVWMLVNDVTHGESFQDIILARDNHLLGASMGVYRSLEAIK